MIIKTKTTPFIRFGNTPMARIATYGQCADIMEYIETIDKYNDNIAMIFFICDVGVMVYGDKVSGTISYGTLHNFGIDIEQ